MPSKEHEPDPQQNEETPNSEAKTKLFYLAARFAAEGAAGQAYFRAQQAIFNTDCDLSAYRFLLNQIWHVAVLGEPPPDELRQQVQRILQSGAFTQLPEETIGLLDQRRQQAKTQGEWVERHYRPGKRL